MSYAKVTIIRGEQGSGKTNTLTGFIVDRALAAIKAIQSPDGKLYPVRPHRGRQVELLGGNGRNRIVTIPNSYIIVPETKVFTNFHLYGIRYVYCTLYDIIRWVNSGLIKDGILGVDEAYLAGEARRSSGLMNVQFTQFAQQMRKRNIELFLLVQHGRFIDWRLRWLATKEITCRYVEETRRVHLIIKNIRKNREKSVSYDAAQYWRYFNTDELPEVPQRGIQKVLARG